MNQNWATSPFYLAFDRPAYGATYATMFDSTSPRGSARAYS